MARPIALFIMLVVVFPLLNRASNAALLLWTNAGGGSTSVPSNWNPAQIPTPADQLLFALNGTYSVTFNATPASIFQSYVAGTVTVNMGTHNTQSLFIADNSNNVATVNIAPADLTASLLRIADESTTTGTLNVSGFATDVAFGSAVIGNSGDATLNVTGGGAFTSGSLIVGNNAGSNSTVNVNDALTFPPVSPTLDVGAGVIGGFGVGVLNVADGGDATFATLAIGAQSGSTGTVTVEGFDDSNLNITSQLNIARNEAATAAGTGTLIVKSNADVTVTGTTFIGDSNGGNGTLRLDGNGTFKTTSLQAVTNFSTLDLRQGLLIIDAGVFDPPGASMVIDSPTTAIPTVELRNRATFDNDGFGLIDIGDGDLYLTSGSSITITQSASVGSQAGELGSLRVDDGASLAVASLGIAGAGDGMVIVNENGQITTPSVGLGFAAASAFGTLDVIGTNAVVDTDQLLIGGSIAGPGGVGIVTIGQGGAVNVTPTGGINTVTVFANGVIHALEGGALDVGASISLTGLLNMLGGSVTADNISITGDLDGYGTVLADVTIQTGGVISPGGGPLLTLGDPTDVNGFNGNLGLLNVGAGSIRLRDSNDASLGNTTINGGTLDLIDDGILLANRTLSGNGSVKGDLLNLGSITNSGGLGLKFLDGILTSENHVINGNRITFGIGGGFEGFGTIACSVIGEAGSSITATGNLTMGNALDPTGVSLAGALDVGAHSVTMLDLANGVPLGTLTKINGGTLIQGIQVFVGAGDVLSGSGTIQSQLANSGGTIRPGGTNAIGTLTATSAFTSGSGSVTGNLEFETAGLNSVDKLVCNSSATLDGDLFFAPIAGFVPVIGQEFVVLTASSIVGSFDAVVLQNAPSTLAAEAIISATQVKLRIIAAPCPADITPPGGNGAVNVDDLLAVINGWGVCPAPPTACAGDIAPTGGNGVVNVDDLLAVINAWGGCP